MKTDLMALMHAYQNYRKLTGRSFNKNTRFKFYEFIKVDHSEKSLASMLDITDDHLSDESVRRIDWLRGPNHEFMYKVWKARNGDNS